MIGMNLPNLRWPVIALTLAISLTGLFGAGFVVKNRTVDEPLKTVLTSAQRVEFHRIERVGKRFEVTVLVKDVPDLGTVYTALDQEIVKILGDAPYTIKVEDRRNGELAEIARRANLYLHEALVTGRFSAMAEQVEAEAAEQGAVARLSVDGERVYLQVHKQGAYLYSVLQRETKERAQRPAEGGIGL